MKPALPERGGDLRTTHLVSPAPKTQTPDSGQSGDHGRHAVGAVRQLLRRRNELSFAISEMAAPLGGMFSGQPPGPPPPPQGLPGQASLLQAAPGTPRSSPSTLVDELESSFEVKGEGGVCSSLPFLNCKLRTRRFFQ